MSDPNTPPPFEAESKPSWPTGLGIVALIFGFGGAIAGLFGLISYFVPTMATNAGLPADFYDQFRSTVVPVTLVGVVISILLGVGGIFLLKRRQKSAKLLKTWAILRMVVSVIATYFSMQVQKATFAAMAEKTASVNDAAAESTAMVANTMASMLPVFLILGILWAWALPVFFLIWFGRAKVQREVSEMS